jgi:dGTPase
MVVRPADPFRERYWAIEAPRSGDQRDEYQRDRARIVHAAAFRRLQAKTQVMGVGEGDFHRTRLTHSIEVGQIGEGILECLRERYNDHQEIAEWLPSRDTVIASCDAHDLGHPPYGHGGEISLNTKMLPHGGFEGNGQTLRIITRLEKYRPHQGINPTRRLVLAILKYPRSYSEIVPVPPTVTGNQTIKPPKCYLDTEREIVDWALEPFTPDERKLFTTAMLGNKPRHRNLDCTLMECADDIAYGVHDLEDIVARRLIRPAQLMEKLEDVFHHTNLTIGNDEKGIDLNHFDSRLFDQGSTERKAMIGRLVNLFLTSTEIYQVKGFEHPLLRYRVRIPDEVGQLLTALKDITYQLVVQRAEVQQLERRGQRIVAELFDELAAEPKRLIPQEAWDSLDEHDSKERRVCDYIAGMTDPYAEKIYRRLFVPGFGSSRDEL